MVEVLLACSITVVLVGAIATVYSFSASRASHAFATGSATNQVQRLALELDKYIGQAQSASVVTVGASTGLKCIMPELGTDTDNDGAPDVFEPKTMTGGAPNWSRGKRIWFYLSNASGDFMQAGPILWMAVRSDDLIPTGANTIRSFTYLPGGTILRFGLLDSITWTANATAKTASFTAKASALARADRKSATAYTTEKSVAQTITLSRTIFCENWRQ
jgi:hypothetical protein